MIAAQARPEQARGRGARPDASHALVLDLAVVEEHAHRVAPHPSAQRKEQFGKTVAPNLVDARTGLQGPGAVEHHRLTVENLEVRPGVAGVAHADRQAPTLRLVHRDEQGREVGVIGIELRDHRRSRQERAGLQPDGEVIEHRAVERLPRAGGIQRLHHAGRVARQALDAQRPEGVGRAAVHGEFHARAPLRDVDLDAGGGDACGGEVVGREVLHHPGLDRLPGGCSEGHPFDEGPVALERCQPLLEARIGDGSLEAQVHLANQDARAGLDPQQVGIAFACPGLELERRLEPALGGQGLAGVGQ